MVLTLLLALHSLARWAALSLGLMALIRTFSGTSEGNFGFPDENRKWGRWFAISLDIQILLGLLMYLFFSTITTSAFENMGSAMSNSVTRFWMVEHPTMMVAALALAHIGVARARKAPEKRRAGLICFGLAMLLIVLGTPWPFSTAARPLLPFL